MNRKNEKNQPITLHPIGILRTPFSQTSGIPRQAVGAMDVQAKIEVYPPFVKGLKDLDGFSHILVLFCFDRAGRTELIANPPWDGNPRGVFSTCSPYRPNHIGMSVVKLVKFEPPALTICGCDMADQTPVLDIKPYLPDLFPREEVKIGWLTNQMKGMTDSKSGRE